MSNTYDIRLYDETLITFEFETSEIGSLTANILEIDNQKEHLLPIDLELTDKGLLRWLRR